MKVLVVDHSVTTRRMMVNALQRIGYTDAIVASDGQSALDAFDGRVGLVILDWNLPDVSGAEMTRALRSHPMAGAVPILVVTTRGAREDIVAAVEAGVSSYMLRPFTPSVLKEKVDRLLAGMGAAA